MSERLRLSARLADVRSSAPALDGARRVRPTDREALASLMLDAYRGTVDEEGGTLNDALAEVDTLLAGGYGAFNENVSEVVERDGRLVAATLITYFEGRPFVAFSMTHPAWQRQGLARAGLRRAMVSLRDRAQPWLDLIVTASNKSAVDLYLSLGFAERVPHVGDDLMDAAKVDAWLFLASAVGDATGRAPLLGLIWAADWMNHAVPSPDELRGGINRLMAAGLIDLINGEFGLTDVGQALNAKERGHAKHWSWSESHRLEQRFEGLQDPMPPLWAPTDAEIAAAYNAYQRASAKALAATLQTRRTTPASRDPESGPASVT